MCAESTYGVGLLPDSGGARLGSVAPLGVDRLGRLLLQLGGRSRRQLRLRPCEIEIGEEILIQRTQQVGPGVRAMRTRQTCSRRKS